MTLLARQLEPAQRSAWRLMAGLRWSSPGASVCLLVPLVLVNVKGKGLLARAWDEDFLLLVLNVERSEAWKQRDDLFERLDATWLKEDLCERNLHQRERWSHHPERAGD